MLNKDECTNDKSHQNTDISKNITVLQDGSNANPSTLNAETFSISTVPNTESDSTPTIPNPSNVLSPVVTRLTTVDPFVQNRQAVQSGDPSKRHDGDSEVSL